MNQNHTTTPTSCTLSHDDFGTLGAGILQSLQLDGRIQAESPPEAMLGALLRLSAQSHPEPSIDILTRERVVLPITPATFVEVDIIVSHVESGTRAVIEVDSWRWHQRTAAEHAREIERDRLLRLVYPHVVRYSATEILRDPWGVLLDVYNQMRLWPAFRAAEMNPALKVVAEACAAIQQPSGSEWNEETECPGPLSTMDYLRAVAAELPPPPPTADPALRRIRQDYPRMYACWERREIEAVQDAFLGRVDIEDIAMALGRSERAIWAQVQRLGLIKE